MNHQQKDDKSLPEFLKEPSVEEPIQKNATDIAGFSPLCKIFAGTIVLWLLLVFVYMQFYFGWSNLAVLLPSEFVIFLAGFLIPLALLLLLVAIIYRTVLSVTQAEAVKTCMSKIVYGADDNMLSQIFNQALQNELQKLTNTSVTLSQQIALLQKELVVKAEDFSNIGHTLDTCFHETLKQLDAGATRLTKQCESVSEQAGKTAESFAAHAETLVANAQALNKELNPLINETLATAEHLQEIIIDNKQKMTQSHAELADFASRSGANLKEMSELLETQEARLEKTFRQTADNCEQIYKRLDSGISHIENSLNTHKTLAAEQSALLDKNSSYLDNKLGEYGRLISLEVEAMIDRASKLDMNVKAQLNVLSSAKDKIEQILDGATNSLEQKSGKAVKNIERIIHNLETELSKLNDFITRTEQKNSEIKDSAEKITRKIGDISNDLGFKVDDLKTRAIEAIDKFNEVSGVVQKNTAQLSETANIIVTKGREGAESLDSQHKSISHTVDQLENVKEHILQIGNNLNAASDNTHDVFQNYKTQIEELGVLIQRQSERLTETQTRTENQLLALKKQFEDLSLNAFIDQSAGLINTLENISVDLNQFLNGSNDDELWKKFYNGDHAVFARNIVKNLNRKQIIRIREEYEKNANFRLIADRYLKEFEALLYAAQQSEKAEALLAMMSGADVGKIYYVTARALDKLK